MDIARHHPLRQGIQRPTRSTVSGSEDLAHETESADEVNNRQHRRCRESLVMAHNLLLCSNAYMVEVERAEWLDINNNYQDFWVGRGRAHDVFHLHEHVQGWSVINLCRFGSHLMKSDGVIHQTLVAGVLRVDGEAVEQSAADFAPAPAARDNIFNLLRDIPKWLVPCTVPIGFPVVL